MIEELQQLIEIIKGMPHMVMWVLAGLLFYKVVLLGSWFGIARLLIIKIYDWSMNPKPAREIVCKYDLGRMFIVSDGGVERFTSLLMSIKNPKLNYIHITDVEWLECAVREKREREKLEGQLHSKGEK